MNKTIRFAAMRNEPWQTWFVKLLCFLLCPFMAFLFSLRDLASKSSYTIFFLFGVVFCWHMDSTGLGQYDDYIGISERFIQNNETSLQYIIEQLKLYITFSEYAPKEIYELILMWSVHQFTDNPHFYFAAASIPFLYFLLRSLSFITRNGNFKLNTYTFLILVLFVLPRDIITVQNPRYSTAVWMYIYAILGYYSSPKLKIKYILLIFLTPLIHAGFWFNVSIFIIGLIACNHIRKCYIAFLCSIPFAIPSFSILSEIDIGFLPGSISQAISSHINHESIYNKLAGTGKSGFFWIGDSFIVLRQLAYIGAAIIIARTIIRHEHRFENNCLPAFLLVFYTASNLIQSLPVISERSFFVVRILCAYAWYIYVYPKMNHYLLVFITACSWEIFNRYLYTGALYRVVPKDIFYYGLPKLILDFI